jgi:DNA-binding NarL/FixJ family response regulator
MAQCVGTKEIADKLCISYTTVRTHIKHILEKLHARNKLEAVTLAFQKGLFK